PATTAFLPFRSMPADNCPAVAGVAMNVRLPPLKYSGDGPVLVTWVTAGPPTGVSVTTPYVWNSDTLTLPPAATVTVPLPWLVNPSRVAPLVRFRAPPLVTFVNVLGPV